MSEEEYAHYETIRIIVKDEVKQVQTNINYFIMVAVVVFGFMFATQFVVYKELQGKASQSEIVGKLLYYQIEEDEHRMLLELAPDQNKASAVYNRINDNIAFSLGFKFSTRGK